MTKEALKLALEILNAAYVPSDLDKQREKAITAVKQALAAPVQEPVHQWRQKNSPYWYDGYPDNDDGGGPYETRTLYTTPPAAQPPQRTEQEQGEIERLTAALKKANEQAEHFEREWYLRGDELERLKTTPPAAQRKPLPAHEIVTMYDERPTGDSDMIAFARAIEAAHGIKE
jgi:hypothetical protein